MGHVKIIQSGYDLEVYEYEKDLNPRRSQSRTRTDRKRDKSKRYFRIDNVRRKIKSFTRLVKANITGDTIPSLFTLTMLEDLGIKRAYSAFSIFTKRLRGYYGKDFRYIAVPEFQNRGAVHFHAIVWGIPQEHIKNERHSRLFQNNWQRGYLDCISTDGSPKLASYLSKYMFKSMRDTRLLGEKAYSTSRNVLRPLSLSYASAFYLSKELWGYNLSTDEGVVKARDFETQWLGKGRYRLFNLKK